MKKVNKKIIKKNPLLLVFIPPYSLLSPFFFFYFPFYSSAHLHSSPSHTPLLLSPAHQPPSLAHTPSLTSCTPAEQHFHSYPFYHFSDAPSLSPFSPFYLSTPKLSAFSLTVTLTHAAPYIFSSIRLGHSHSQTALLYKKRNTPAIGNGGSRTSTGI